MKTKLTILALIGVTALAFADEQTGAGHFTASLVLDALSVTIYPNISGTYNVNADGTGTINWVSSGIQRSRAFVIGDGVKQIRYVHTDPSVAQTFGGTMVKQ